MARFLATFSALAMTAFTIIFASAALAQDDSYPTIGSAERLDPKLDELVPPDAKIEVLAEGFEWSEGPAWVKDGGFLVFSDVLTNTVYRWKEGEGASVYLKPSGYTGSVPRGAEMGSNGLALDPEGRLVLCQHGDRRVARMDAPTSAPEPKFVTLAGGYDGKKFNSPNDLAIHSGGAVYFTDPPYGLEKQWRDPAREFDFCGVYRVAPDGTVTLLTDELVRPNGIALSPDEKRLYVAQSDRLKPLWMVYDVQDDGSIANGRVFFDAKSLAESREGSCDGLKVDEDGNLFATGPGGVVIFDPNGNHLGTILTGQRTANCAFGDDGQTLYMTADMLLCRIRLSTTGAGF